MKQKASMKTVTSTGKCFSRLIQKKSTVMASFFIHQKTLKDLWKWFSECSFYRKLWVVPVFSDAQSLWPIQSPHTNSSSYLTFFKSFTMNERMKILTMFWPSLVLSLVFAKQLFMDSAVVVNDMCKDIYLLELCERTYIFLWRTNSDRW